MEMEMEIDDQVFGDLPCKGGVSMLVGVIVKQTDKAVQIHYANEPVFAGGYNSVTIATWGAWIPKSQIVEKNGCYEIKKWFTFNALKPFRIKPHRI